LIDLTLDFTMGKATIFFVVFFALTIAQGFQGFDDEYEDTSSTDYQQDLGTSITTTRPDGIANEVDVLNATQQRLQDEDIGQTSTKDERQEEIRIDVLNATQRLIEQQRLLDEEIGQTPTKDERQEEIRIKLPNVEGICNFVTINFCYFLFSVL